MDQAPTAMASRSSTWDSDGRLFWHCRCCRSAMNSLGNVKYYAHQCTGINNEDLHCGYLTAGARWRVMSTSPGSISSDRLYRAALDHSSLYYRTNTVPHVHDVKLDIKFSSGHCDISTFQFAHNHRTITTPRLLGPPASPPSNLTRPLDCPRYFLSHLLQIYCINTEPQPSSDNHLDLTQILDELSELVTQNPPCQGINNFDMPHRYLLYPSPIWPAFFPPQPPIFPPLSLCPQQPTTPLPTGNQNFASRNPACNAILSRCTYYRDIAQCHPLHEWQNFCSPPLLFVPDSPDACPHHQFLHETEWPLTFPNLSTCPITTFYIL